MNKVFYLSLSGIAMALAGAAILLSESIGIETSRILVPIFFIAGGALAYLFGSANEQHKIASQYHKLQGIGMALFGTILAIIPTNLEAFLKYTVYFMFLFAIIEILYAFLALNSGQKLNINILISRFLAGFCNLIGAILILATSATDEIGGLNIAGALILLGGLAFLVFSFRIKKVELTS